VTLLALAAAERPAQACSCGSPIMLSPTPEATGVPRNARLAIYFSYGVGEEVPAFALRGAGGAEVAITVQAERLARIVFIQPDAPLAAGAAHELDLPGGTTISFTTGDALDETAPAFAGLAGLEAHDYPYPGPGGCHNSCASGGNRYSRLELAYDPPGADTAFLLLEVWREGEATPSQRIPLAWRPWAHIDTIACGPAISPLAPGETYCARLLAHDAAGNVAGAGAEVCAPVESCANVPDDNCLPERGCPEPPDPPDDECIPEEGCGTIIEPERDAGRSGCAATGIHPRDPGAAMLLLAGLLLLAARARRRARG
jgi:uncharacterized protein (TIGR03382 family)